MVVVSAMVAKFHEIRSTSMQCRRRALQWAQEIAGTGLCDENNTAGAGLCFTIVFVHALSPTIMASLCFHQLP